MDYLQIDLKGTSTIDLHSISTWHNQTPRLWIPGYEPSSEEIDETINRMKNNPCYVCVAKDTELRGFIWAEREENAIMIMSLYVDESVRQSNVGTTLKESLEAWCLKEGIKKIKTTVHSKNKKMIALNEKMGYESKMLHMEKLL